jgi:LPXTG-site transpeptidase (sortase) family protein
MTRTLLALSLLLLVFLGAGCGSSSNERGISEQAPKSDVSLTTALQPATLVPTFTPTAPPTELPTATVPPTVDFTPVPTATPEPSRQLTQGPPNRITAPSIGLDAKVVPLGWHQVTAEDGSTYSDWDVASFVAGWHKNSGLPGEGTNVVLSGHHNIEGEVFRYVVDLKVGDTVTLWEEGNRYDYFVQQTMILEDKDVPYEQRLDNALWLNPSEEERLTLVTCWPYTNNTHRVIVVALPAEQP